MARTLVAAAVAVVAASLAVPASAANVPLLVSVGQEDRHPVARWTLPPEVEAATVDVARRPDLMGDGSFVTTNVVLSEPVAPNATSWRSAARLDSGTYFLMVSGFDNSCEGRCGAVHSNVLQLAIPRGETMLWGRGIGPWRINQRRAVRDGLIRSVRYPKNGGPGCLLGPWDATRIDYYPGIRLSWINGYLFDIATTRAGDRTRAGFVVGESRLGQVRERYPRVPVARTVYGKRVYPRPPTRFNLGYRALVLSQRTGYETWTDLVYWFNRKGLLVALETNVGGC